MLTTVTEICTSALGIPQRDGEKSVSCECNYFLITSISMLSSAECEKLANSLSNMH